MTYSIDKLTEFIGATVEGEFRRGGAVVGVSGGVDSAVTLGLCVRALGSDRVLGLLLPERESSSASTELAESVCAHFGVRSVVEDLTSALEGFNCYSRRDEAVADAYPDYDPGASTLRMDLYQDLRRSRLPAMYKIVIEDTGGVVTHVRPTVAIYRRIFAASNFKQRLRTVALYYHAEVHNYCVVGTSNLDEEYLGFFVKGGDGTWDLGPLESLTKSEVRSLARELLVPDDILQRPTTTDTFPVEEQSQEDMFYGLPFDSLDPLLTVLARSADPARIATELGWTQNEVDNALHNLKRRHRSTEWNRLSSVRPTKSQ